MTIKEKNNLLIIKQKISDDCDCSNITDTELYEMVDNKCLIDLVDFDLVDFEEKRDELLDWVEEFQDKKQTIQRLETLFLYIEKSGYELESFLNYVDYSEDNLDFTTLSLEELTYIEEQIEASIAEVEYNSKLESLEQMAYQIEEAKKSNTYVDSITFFDTFLNDKDNELEALKKEIEALKSANKLKSLQHNIEQFQILQKKDFLSTHELASIYPNMSLNRQTTYRGRIHDPLPFQQLKKGAKITYCRKDVDIWIANNNK